MIQTRSYWTLIEDIYSVIIILSALLMEIKENVLIVTEKNSKYTKHKDDITRI